MITTWDALPLVMKVEHMAALKGVERSTIWKACQERRMHPAPVSYDVKPYEWHRDEVRAYYEHHGQVPTTGRAGRRKAFANVSEWKLAKAQLLKAAS